VGGVDAPPALTIDSMAGTIICSLAVMFFGFCLAVIEKCTHKSVQELVGMIAPEETDATNEGLALTLEEITMKLDRIMRADGMDPRHTLARRSFHEPPVTREEMESIFALDKRSKLKTRSVSMNFDGAACGEGKGTPTRKRSVLEPPPAPAADGPREVVSIELKQALSEPRHSSQPSDMIKWTSDGKASSMRGIMRVNGKANGGSNGSLGGQLASLGTPNGASNGDVFLGGKHPLVPSPEAPLATPSDQSLSFQADFQPPLACLLQEDDLIAGYADLTSVNGRSPQRRESASLRHRIDGLHTHG